MLYLLLPALLAAAPAMAGATPPGPERADAPVPETRYQPLPAYQPAEKPPTTPDRHWVEANRTVLGYQPMMLTMPPRPAAPAPQAKQPAADAASTHGQTHDHAHEGRHRPGKEGK